MNSNYKVVEGDDYRRLKAELFSKKRFYKYINLNKILLSDVIPDFSSTIKKNFKDIIIYYIETIFLLLKSLIKILIYKTVLDKISIGNKNIWFLVPPTSRPSYKKEIATIDNKNFNPDLITWKYKLNTLDIKQTYYRLLFFIKQLAFFYINSVNLKKNIQFNYQLLKIYDLESDFGNHKKPEAVFSIKDFQRFENAIIQIANNKLIPTFTTQHSVHHYFTEHNERIGNMMIDNLESKNLLLWGDFNKNLYKNFNPETKLHVTQAYLRPKIDFNEQNDVNPNLIIICLGCNRRLPETEELLITFNKINPAIIKDLNIIIRLHPSVNYDKYKKVIKNLNLNFEYKIQQNKNEFTYEYNKNNIFITGLSGAYYDLTYLGFKTIFFDYHYSLFEKLPRVLKPCTNHYQLGDQIVELIDMETTKWYKICENIVKFTTNHDLMEKKDKSIIEDISKIIF